MSTYEQFRPSVNIPQVPASQRLDSELALPDRASAPAGRNTDSMMLMGEARTRMLAERLNAEMAKARVELLYELRTQQQEHVITRATRIMEKMRDNADNPLLLDGLQASFYDWLAESRAVIRHTMERGW